MKYFTYVVLALMFLAFSACSSGSEVTPSGEVDPTPAGFQGVGLPLVRNEHFSGSGACAICHTRMVDEAGEDVSTDTLWRATMMANAARDTYWQASVRKETLHHPTYRFVIEDKCSNCHMPMAHFTSGLTGRDGLIFEDGFADPNHDLHPLAMDGVSCNLCHQIQPDNFGQSESFSGGFLIDPDLPAGEREAFGPYEIANEQASVMQSVSGFIPLKALHIEQSELCGVCHTLFTPTLDAQGEIVGEFPEQTVYLEWLNSAYPETQSCQGCHMPVAQGGVQLSTTGGPKRSPFYQHYFVGGNVYMARTLQAYGEELQVASSADQLETTIANATDQIQNRTATLSLEDVHLEDGYLLADVLIRSQVGHKLPGGFPSRRVWVHFTVQDESGQVVFESGAVTPDGFISGNANDEDPAQFEPHYQEITQAGQVQIYEAIMVDTDGNPTTILLRGSGYVKDNRILPDGFNKNTAPAEIAVYGEAAGDATFHGGGDSLHYRVNLGQVAGPFTVTVELLFQTIGFRWAMDLHTLESPEIELFTKHYAEQSNLPLVIATASAEVGK